MDNGSLRSLTGLTGLTQCDADVGDVVRNSVDDRCHRLFYRSLVTVSSCFPKDKRLWNNCVLHAACCC